MILALHNYVYICGDFNANLLQTSRFGKELSEVCSDNSLIILASPEVRGLTVTESDTHFNAICGG